jgi:CelD/BcsL family acetyltransferase involved in cellulose biosynthesis
MLAYSTQNFAEASAELLDGWTRFIADAGLNASLTPGWLRVAADALAAGETKISLLVGAADGRVAALVPFYAATVRMVGIPLRQLELGSNLTSYHAELLAPGRCAEALAALLEREKWDVLRASNVPLGSETAGAIEAAAGRFGSRLQVLAGERSPYLAIDGAWQDFMATKDKKFRYKWRKRKESIEPGAELRLEWRTREDEVAGLLRDVLAIEEQSWKATEGTTIASRAYEMRFQEMLLRYLAKSGLLVANVLYKESTPIAYSVCCRYGGWVGHLKTSFVDAFKDLSPGGIVIDASVEWAFEAKAREFDFLGNAAPHKLAWTSTVREHADYFVFGRGLKPRLVVAMKSAAQAAARMRARPPSSA